MLVSGLWVAEAFGGWSLSQVQVKRATRRHVRDPAGKLIAVMVLDIADGRIQALPSIANPDQLRHLDHGATP